MKNCLAKIFLFVICLIAEGLGRAQDQSYEIGLAAQKIELQKVRYALESVDRSFDPDHFQNFSEWKLASSVVYLWANEVRDKRLVINFALTLTHAMPIYIEYPWNMPTRDARLFIRDAAGQITTAELFRAQAPIWTSYLPRGTYHFLAVLEPSAYADAKTGINVMNASYMTGFRSSQSSFRILIYGIGLAFIFFNLAMYILHRAPYFIYYVGYSLSILYLLGIGSSHVYYPHASLWNVALWLNGLFAALMSSSVLRLKKFHPRLLQLSLIFVAFASVFFSLAYVLSMPALIFGGYLVGLVVYFICVYAAIRRMLSGYVPAIFFATGWAVLFLGYVLNMVGLYILNFHILNWSAYIAYALESMLFAVALAYRTRDTEVRAVQDKVHALSQL